MTDNFRVSTTNNQVSVSQEHLDRIGFKPFPSSDMPMLHAAAAQLERQGYRVTIIEKDGKIALFAEKPE